MTVRRRRDTAWAVIMLAGLLLATPLRGLWLQPDLPWWTPYAVWLVLILVGSFISARWHRDVR